MFSCSGDHSTGVRGEKNEVKQQKDYVKGWAEEEVGSEEYCEKGEMVY